LYPTSPIAGDGGLTVFGSGNNVTSINEVTIDDTNGVRTPDSTERINTYNLTQTSQTGTITNVTVNARTKEDTGNTSGTARFGIVSGGNSHVYAASLTDTFALFQHSWSVEPQSGSAWTWVMINALQGLIDMAGVQADKMTFYTVYCSWFNVTVTYTPPAVVPQILIY
jgi:hypothetical protein